MDLAADYADFAGKDGFVMLSEAKHLWLFIQEFACNDQRFFGSLRMTD
jgi:hypothetical protein